ncbi:MAG: HAD-IA family hydrolase [Syntrophales bacterium]|jgi:phosphoglycolate phosphatase|nr:HAD-IA family hydrolase [Syntrophales bacterium]MDY0044542.1 HAD-IA family hydrolase [Syntrophales bacterium]
MKRIDFMVFDFDGTLVNTGHDIVNAVNHMRQELNEPLLDKDTVMRYIGDGVNKLIERSLDKGRITEFDRAKKIFLSYYETHLFDTTTLYPGARETLDYFDNTRKVIITNKNEYLTLKIVKHFGIEHYFEEILGIDSKSYAKPDERLLLPYLDRFSAGKRSTLVIGDGVNDILFARNARVLSCALLNGLGDRDELIAMNPDFYCEEMKDLRMLFY